MSALHSMPMFWADFFADTEHLSPDAAHAHLFLIGHAWLRGAKLVDDDRALSRMARMSLKKWLSMRTEVLSLWSLSEGFWSQKRLSKEYDYVSRKAEDNRNRGSLGGKRTAEKNAAKSTEPPKQTLQQPTPTPTPIKEREPNGSPKKPTPRQILETVLCPETANDVIEHRQAKKAKLTERAAQGLIREFIKTGNPEDAARVMIERGWQGFEAKWYANDGGGSGRHGKRTISDALSEAQGRIVDLFPPGGDGMRGGTVLSLPAARFRQP